MASKVLNSKDPDAAYERMIQHLAVVSGASSSRLSDDFYASASQIFERKGGSWFDLFEGSTRDLGMLKGIVRYLLKRGS